MFELARAEELTTGEREATGRSDEPDSVAGRVDCAVLDDRIFDVVSGDGIIAGEESAAGDSHTAIPRVRLSPEVDAVPASLERDVLDENVRRAVEQKRIVGGIAECYPAECYVTAV